MIPNPPYPAEKTLETLTQPLKLKKFMIEITIYIRTNKNPPILNLPQP